jgi:hypothetical protein
MHTKKRNRLLHKRLNDLVFVSYNRKMQSRFIKRKEKAGTSYDPLVIEDFDWDNEWIDSSVVHREGGSDNDLVALTWDHVDDATGASVSLRGRNLPRQATRRNYTEGSQRRGRARLEEPEEDSHDGGSEDIEDDPHDDIDVSNSDEEVGGEDGEQSMDPSILDEFDDGY